MEKMELHFCAQYFPFYIPGKNESDNGWRKKKRVSEKQENERVKNSRCL